MADSWSRTLKNLALLSSWAIGRISPFTSSGFPGCVPWGPTTVTNKHRLGQMAELGLNLRTPHFNVIVWEFQQNLRTPGEQGSKASLSAASKGQTPI